jgi:glycosyltransferase involved in cell wall biosynthesis
MDLKISIITPSFNHEKYIRDTIESVLNQNYSNFEHIVIDGGSLDKTIEILKEYKHLKWISEKDNGPVEAIIKGFKMSSGNIFTWLNSDDYFEKNIFKDIAEAFKYEKTRIIVGNMMLVGPNRNILFENNYNDIYYLDYLVRINSDIIRQPSTFFRKELFYEVGGFDYSLKLVWDYDLFLKMLKTSKPKFVNKLFAYQRIYETTLSRSSLRRQALEIFKVSRRNGARLCDKINYLILKRFLFPSLYKKEQSPIIKSLKSLKHLIN